MGSFGIRDIEQANDRTHWFDRSVVEGNAYRVSLRHTMSSGEQLIVYFEPVESGGTIHIAPPAIESPQLAYVDVWENPPDPSANFADDVFVHAMRYDTSPETPEAVVNRVTTGNLDTTPADTDQTEESLVRGGQQFNTPGDSSRRGIWRTIPVGETIAMVVTDQSNGSGNQYSFDTVVYEGDTFPE